MRIACCWITSYRFTRRSSNSENGSAAGISRAYLGRLGAKDHQGVSFDNCWIDRATLGKGSAHVRSVLQVARRKWKERAKNGLTHGLLIMFNFPQLAFARPGAQFLEARRKLTDLYLVEHAPVEPDVIYTEAVPLELDSKQLAMFKATVTLFYTGAHRTRAHDRRVPGGLMILMVSVRHLANSLVTRGLDATLELAVKKGAGRLCRGEFARARAFGNPVRYHRSGISIEGRIVESRVDSCI
jgi:hypothetical protein